MDDTNLFAYCGNNPVNNIDADGELFNTIVGAIVGGFVAAFTRDKSGESFGDAFVRGAVTGAISGAGLDIAVATGGAGIPIAAALGTFAGGVDSYWEQKNNGKSTNWGEVAVSAVTGGLTNTLFGAYGREAGRAVGNTLKGVANAMWKNTVRAVATKSGKITVSTFVKGVAKGMLESVVSGGASKLYSLVGNKLFGTTK